ncbi:MAG: hypothetical protein JSS46_12810 [Proteobacteria bacterium]|jgi:hypothetical protein|nr:hypothetical protein [Pseudomonadota bacterium]
MTTDAMPGRNADAQPALTSKPIAGSVVVAEDRRAATTGSVEQLARAWADCDLAGEMLES